MSTWRIGRRSGSCAHCGCEFPEESTHFSHLYVEAEGIGRRDLCPACWPAVELGPDQPWWRARRRANPKRGLAVDLGLLEQLFLMTAEAQAQRLLELRYLIALLLLRKRRLLLSTVRRDGDGERLVLRRPRRKEELPVRVFDFDAERRETLRGELEQLLETGDLDPTPVAEHGEGPAEGPAQGPPDPASP